MMGYNKKEEKSSMKNLKNKKKKKQRNLTLIFMTSTEREEKTPK
jgi:hypothetical protein